MDSEELRRFRKYYDVQRRFIIYYGFFRVFKKNLKRIIQKKYIKKIIFKNKKREQH
jgi:hypothetical protein